MTGEEWEELGRNVSNNTHLTNADLSYGVLNDHKISFFFRGLTKSTSIEVMLLYHNQLSAAGVRCMVPFLYHANNLTHLDISDNIIQSEGFNELFRALRNSPIEELYCNRCGVESIEIDSDHIPRNLQEIFLEGNYISADGCRELAKLLRSPSNETASLQK